MPAVNDSIAGYQIEVELGTNAWGRAFRARQVSLDRPVYLTLLPPDFASTNLARACAGLTHPHLVSGIDFGDSRDGTYLVTEWVEGPTLGDVVHRGGPVAEERGLEILRATSQALDVAARKGIVHGAIDPESIVITSGGSPKIRGFGPDRDYATTPEDYRSPELKDGDLTDVRADIYSLGATMYFALSGRYPFLDAPPPEVVDGVVHEMPFPLGQANRRLSPEVVTLVDHMMAFSAEDRYPHASDLVRAVNETCERLDERIRLQPRVERTGPRRARPASPPRPARPRRRRRR